MYGLKSFLFFNDLGQLEVANYLGLSKVQMSRLVAGTVPFRHEYLVKLITNEKGWNTEFLTDPLWAELESGKKGLASDGASAVRNNLSAGVKSLPLIPFEAVAGYGTPTYNDVNNLEYYMVREFANCDFLIRVKGDSMTPKFTGGDVVACKKINETLFFQWGRVYVLYTQSQGVMIKRIQPSEKEDCIKCVSDNEKYAPFDVPKSDIVSLALVSGSITLE